MGSQLFSSLDELASSIEEKLAAQAETSQDPPQLDSVTLQKLTHLLDEAHKFVEFLRLRFFDHTAQSDEASNDKAASGIKGKGFLQTIQIILARALTHPESLAKHYAQFAGLVLQILRRESDLAPTNGDRRFKDEMWCHSALYQGILQIYLAWSRSIQTWVNEQEFSERDRQRVQFIFDQLTAAFAPSNLPLNPAALKRAENSKGESVVSGIREWMRDAVHNRAMPRQILPDAYTLGKELAATPGVVVYRNPTLELIQYQPQTPRVHRRPVLLIPPQINKYYVFDLRSNNSILGYFVKHGFQVFTLSWRNPSNAEKEWGMDAYIQATLEAIEAICDIARSRTLSLISACAGGLTAMALLGYLAEKKRPLVKSHSLLVTALQSNNGSALEIFATPEALEHVRTWSQINGVMEGKELSKIFCWLRPNELVWNYWVNNYLMGRKPPALDVLYWDNDPTRLPAQLHSDFLDMYAKEVFDNPHTLQVMGAPIDFRKVRVDTYFVGGREDYLMPWEGVYQAAKLFRGKHEFILSTSGHVQSILRPPNIANTEYFTNTHLPATPQEWLNGATRREGSWWPHWMQWMVRQSGSLKKAPSHLGSQNYPTLMAAPGSYVFERS